MCPLLQCIALLMAALWLPATQHCTLDGLGIIEAHVQHHDHDTGCATHGDETQHAHDTCVLVEFSPWLDTAAHLDAPPPQISPGSTLAALADILNSALRIPHSPPALQPFSPSALSPDWFPSRHFVNREAPPTRAPSATQA